MKFQLLYLTGISLLLFACTRRAQPLSAQLALPDPAYDPALATQAGSDSYGMHRYVMAFLKAGPNRNQDSLEVIRLQKGHMENIGRLAEAGKLVLAGPFMDGGELRGIYVFDVATLEEARALTETDPAIKAGRLVMELHSWYGSAALRFVNPLHKRLEQKSIGN